MARCICSTSPPALNARPAPVRTSTFESASFATSPNKAASSASMGSSTAFKVSGRFMVACSTLPSRRSEIAEYREKSICLPHNPRRQPALDLSLIVTTPVSIRQPLQVIIRIAVRLLDGEQPFEVVPDRILIRHAHAAVQLNPLCTHQTARGIRDHLGGGYRGPASGDRRLDVSQTTIQCGAYFLHFHEHFRQALLQRLARQRLAELRAVAQVIRREIEYLFHDSERLRDPHQR